MENVWHYLRENTLCALVWDSYDAIVEACVTAWQFLINDPDRIRSIGTREWARAVSERIGITRLAQDRFEFGDPRRQALDHLRLLKKQGTLRGVTQAKPGRERHPYLDPYPEAARNPHRHPGEHLHDQRREYVFLWHCRTLYHIDGSFYRKRKNLAPKTNQK